MKILLINAYRDKSRIKTLLDFLKKAVDEVIVVGDTDIPEDNFSGAVISGSENLIAKGEYSEFLAQWLKSVEIPVLGICFGHQIISYAYGGVIKDTGKPLKKTITVEILNKDRIFQGLPKYIKVSESHQEYVDIKSIKDKFEILATSKFTEVEAIVHKKLPIYGVQFHIERSGEVGMAVLENFLGIIEKNS